MPRRNRVDPWGDLHASPERGLFTGNRGCLVNDRRELVRHHSATSWITCVTEFRDSDHPLDEPRIWTPLFFLDDAVALAAGHRPCGLCRRADYVAYRDAVSAATDAAAPIPAKELARLLAAETLRPGQGLDRADDRILWTARVGDLPQGTVIVDTPPRLAHLVTDRGTRSFAFGGWGPLLQLPAVTVVEVLTPPTSVAALRHGFTPRLHDTASDGTRVSGDGSR